MKTGELYDEFQQRGNGQREEEQRRVATSGELDVGGRIGARMFVTA
jgi:hypothetical protein